MQTPQSAPDTQRQAVSRPQVPKPESRRTSQLGKTRGGEDRGVKILGGGQAKWEPVVIAVGIKLD